MCGTLVCRRGKVRTGYREREHAEQVWVADVTVAAVEDYPEIRGKVAVKWGIVAQPRGDLSQASGRSQAALRRLQKGAQLGNVVRVAG